MIGYANFFAVGFLLVLLIRYRPVSTRLIAR
jgi:hypothetical protein